MHKLQKKPSTMFQNYKQPLLFTFLKIKRDVAKPQKKFKLNCMICNEWNHEIENQKKRESQCRTTWKINLLHLLMFWISHLFAITSNNKTTKATTKPLQIRTHIQTNVALKHTNCSNNNQYQNFLPPSNGLQTNKKTP